jgi:hypothetical protein
MVMRWLASIFQQKSCVDESQANNDLDANQMSETHSADNPIKDSSQDSLGRTSSAEIFCSNILRLDASEGLVVGVLGPWGSGKTSFVNLARNKFNNESICVIDFNPWMFSGAEQLVQSFFSELSSQLRLKPELAEIGKAIGEYGDLFNNFSWLPLIGPWIGRGTDLAKAISALLQRKRGGISGEKARVSDALKKSKQKIIVVLDDIDRLSTHEIREVFRLVRLTANFPNLIYLLAFDRRRIEAALSEDGFPGRAYLEKILQISFDLPSIPETVLNQRIFKAIELELSGEDVPGRFNSDLWPDVFMEIVKPLISNMRDVRRYAAAVGGTARELRGEIELVDVLALEAIRTFLPDVFHQMPAMASTLTRTSGSGYRNDAQDAAHKKEIEDLINAADKHQQVVRNLIRRLFMAAERHIGNIHYGAEWTKTWLRERRVANIEIFRLYLEKVASQGLIAFNAAEQAWLLMPISHEFEGYIRGLPQDQIVDVISNLEAYEDNVSEDRVLPGVVTLLNIAPSLPEIDQGMFGFSSQMTVRRVVYRLLKSIESPDAVEAVVSEAIPQLLTSHAKRTLIDMVGYTENAGHKMVSVEAAERLKREWRVDFFSLSAESMAKEPELLWSILDAQRERDPEDPQLIIPEDPEVTLAILSSSRSEAKSQADGSRAIKRHPRLAWEALEEVFGDATTLHSRINSLRDAQSTDTGDLLVLADRYLAGWRPNHFEDD